MSTIARTPAHSLLIGEVARRTGRSIHTIRWYEAQGLMLGVVRDGGGRRVYSEHHVGWLDLMDRLRSTGMSIAGMRAYVELVKQGSTTLKERRALLAAHQAQVRDAIARSTEALALIDAKIEFYDEWLADGHRPSVGPHRRIPTPKAASD
ncbi:MAG TPA: MerR family transcriptional regulator [Aliidongia sp.]|uniref:MerR family transcriptional regulator n=1 Tax=Aliidongia sp. TaxID=1914230 RepID=UPI002DDDADF9|nr:MerR family transcriptional regulator [Aliidongia sp.]HEV2675507.1 MerR family transcriptional regulator [Aliidongia sp.]